MQVEEALDGITEASEGAEEFDDGEEVGDHYVFFLTGEHESAVIEAATRLARLPGAPGGAFMMITDSDAAEFGLGRRVNVSPAP